MVERNKTSGLTALNHISALGNENEEYITLRKTPVMNRKKYEQLSSCFNLLN